MTVGSRYRINEKQVVYQSFDEEIISINLDLGTYYSLRGAGVEFWSWIAKGYDWAAIRQAIGETFPWASRLQLKANASPSSTSLQKMGW